MIGSRIHAHVAELPVTLRRLRVVPAARGTEISRHPSVWRLRDEQTARSVAQERLLNRVAANDEHAKVIGWAFSLGGPLVVQGCGDWGVINGRGRWIDISRESRDEGGGSF